MPHLGMSSEKSPIQSSAVSGECFAGDGNTLATGGEGIFMRGEGLAKGGGKIAREVRSRPLQTKSCSFQGDR